MTKLEKASPASLPLPPWAIITIIIIIISTFVSSCLGLKTCKVGTIRGSWGPCGRSMADESKSALDLMPSLRRRDKTSANGSRRSAKTGRHLAIISHPTIAIIWPSSLIQPSPSSGHHLAIISHPIIAIIAIHHHHQPLWSSEAVVRSAGLSQVQFQLRPGNRSTGSCI